MPEVPNEITLATLDGGGAAELWQHEFRRLMTNIADRNTDPDAVREITLKVKLKPHADRELLETKYTVTSKPAGHKPVGGFAYIGKTRDGTVVATGKDVRQTDAFETEEEKAAVTPITSKTAQEGK